MNEYFIVQNYAIGALALYNFTKAYDEESEHKGAPVPLIFIILPIVYNEKCLLRISEVRKVTGKVSMLNILTEHRDIPVGLQRRMVEMRDQSLKSLNISFTTGLLKYDKAAVSLIPGKYLRIPTSNSNGNQRIFHASRIIGKWFAHNSVEQICISLNITFKLDEF